MSRRERKKGGKEMREKGRKIRGRWVLWGEKIQNGDSTNSSFSSSPFQGPQALIQTHK